MSFYYALYGEGEGWGGDSLNLNLETWEGFPEGPEGGTGDGEGHLECPGALSQGI